ncbi:hypothetical protein PIB30_082854 [Stylosanthes scabra]|uniref:Uncharacterized protein n=1 Tax=Stylosanthes scabra TaxID=79078 RepID=A0ABU6TSV4_9FABA|nr:hypothetical protein [Stylosanthes scabra]
MPRFKTLFHEADYKGKLSARKVLPELIIEYNDEILSECAVQIKKPLLNHNHHKSNHNPKFTNNKSSPPTSTLTLTPPCHKFIGGLTNNKKRVGRALRPSTQEWTAWMIN